MAARFGARWSGSIRRENPLSSGKGNQDPEKNIPRQRSVRSFTRRHPQAFGSLSKIGLIARRPTLYLVDVVTSLGGCEVKVDEWGIDISYS
jgi:hypothetical protein